MILVADGVVFDGQEYDLGDLIELAKAVNKVAALLPAALERDVARVVTAERLGDYSAAWRIARPWIEAARCVVPTGAHTDGDEDAG